MFPLILIVAGIAVLLFGRRLAVLGAAVGAAPRSCLAAPVP